MAESELPHGARRIVPNGCASSGAIDLRRLQALASHRGFVRCAALPATAFPGAQAALEQWLTQGHGAEMDYLRTKRDAPRQLLTQAKTLIVVALPHTKAEAPNGGPIASYALGPDYHHAMRNKLWRLAEDIAGALGRQILARVAVDTAPLLEREAATRAGLGFTGKNTMHIIPGVGSFILLGELLLDVELESDIYRGQNQTPPQRDELTSAAAETKRQQRSISKQHRLPVAQNIDLRSLPSSGCGECTACIDACPTDAFVAPFNLDARRCISYLTIEQSGSVPPNLRSLMGTWAFGCDVCQNVCPYNGSKKRPEGDADLAPAAAEQRPLFDQLVALLRLTSGDYRRFTRGQAQRRASRAQLQRNAAIALGNLADKRAVPALVDALQGNRAPLVRAHAAWALGQFDDTDSQRALKVARDTDADELVRKEAEAALKA